MESLHKANTQRAAQSHKYDCALGKEELRPVYNALIAPHLTQISQPDWGFDKWYATLDTWNRTMIYASQLKKYLLSVSFNKWGDFSRMMAGLSMDNIERTPKLSEVPHS